MANIEEIIEKKPHLKDVLILYKKVIEFRKIVSSMYESPTIIEDVAYPAGLIDPIFNSFSSIIDIPEGDTASLKEAIKLGQVNFAKLPLNEPSDLAIPFDEDEMKIILFIISKPYFLWLKKSCNIDNTFWQEGKCPVCNSTPSIAAIHRDGIRHLYCSYCETKGHYKRMGCPSCLNEDTTKMTIITAEGEDGFRIDTCDKCNSYLKTINIDLLDNLTPDLVDLISLPLDIIAQGKGYSRLSPNPVGMLKMT